MRLYSDWIIMVVCDVECCGVRCCGVVVDTDGVQWQCSGTQPNTSYQPLVETGFIHNLAAYYLAQFVS